MRRGAVWRLHPDHRLLLRAALGRDAEAADAYRQWRRSVRLDEIDVTAFRLLPSLVQTARKHAVADAELPRIQGAVKHTWLRNVLRARALGDALRALNNTGVESLVLKGAALFARYPHLASARGTGDYDILIRRQDAARAAKALLGIGFRPDIVRLDLFKPSDFTTIHGAHFVKGERDGSLDLHWRPLPHPDKDSYTDELFARSESGMFAGHQVHMPSLADHLFLTVARADPLDSHETLLRAAEAAFLLRGCNGTLDWEHFISLAGRFDCGQQAHWLLGLVARETSSPVPDAILARLAGRRATRQFAASSVAALPPALARVQAAMASSIIKARVLAWAVRSAARRLAPRTGGSLDAVWQSRRDCPIAFDGPEPAFIAGFSFPEDAGRWTDGKLAVLAIPLAAGCENDIVVRLTAAPFCPRAGAFAFDICAGPSATRRHVIRRNGGASTTFAIENLTVLEAPRRIVVVLRLVDAACPRMLGLSDDPRLLGLMLQKVEIMRASAVVATFDLAAPPLPGETVHGATG